MKFEWIKREQRQTFTTIKDHFKRLPTITRSEVGDKLQLYVAVCMKMVATILLVRKDKYHHPIYFRSHVLARVEKRHELPKKIAYAILIAARKPRPYFDAHTLQVLANQPLEKAHHNLDTTGRQHKWAIELS